MQRKLASIRVIQEIKFIEGADRICAYRVDGWWVVDSINKYSIGELVIYLEVDSWVPHDLAPFLSKGKEPREYKGVKGERLRTIKLKGQLSQGLLLPLTVLGESHETFAISDSCIGADVTEQLGILKWEPQLPAQLAGDVQGLFPSEIPKTDQERIQNLDIDELRDQTYEVTEKLHGSSCTMYLDLDGEFHVCSRT